ncbi:hypothetical protein [Streptomyces sp. LMG1-1-1.1]
MWACPRLTVVWAERFATAERDLADAMLADIEEWERKRPWH